MDEVEADELRRDERAGDETRSYRGIQMRGENEGVTWKKGRTGREKEKRGRARVRSGGIVERTKHRIQSERESNVLNGAAVSETCQRIRDLDSLLLPRSLSLMNV